MAKAEWDNCLWHCKVCSGKREWRDNLDKIISYPEMGYVRTTHRNCKPRSTPIFAGCFTDLNRYEELQLRLLMQSVWWKRGTFLQGNDGLTSCAELWQDSFNRIRSCRRPSSLLKVRLMARSDRQMGFCKSFGEPYRSEK